MYNDLPAKIKNEVKRLLAANQFPRAKALHNAWMLEQAWHYATE